MQAFATLLEQLIHTPSRNRKLALLADYFAQTPDPDRGIALAAMTGELILNNIKPAALKKITKDIIDPVLFDLSYDYVGDMAETIALIWPTQKAGVLPTLNALIKQIEQTPKPQVNETITALFDIASPNERWAMIKLLTGGLRIGVSARLAKTALAQYSGQSLNSIEEIWHGIHQPYTALFAWLDGHADKPNINPTQMFHPMMLAHPIDAAKDLPTMAPADYQAEWKWDGIRVQLVFDGEEKRMFSRTGDDISAAFPDVIESLTGSAVLDGELLVGAEFKALPFNCLQQRLNRKSANKKLMQQYPAFVRVYDMLFDGQTDIRQLALSERRSQLTAWLAQHRQARLDLSEVIYFDDWDTLSTIRTQGAAQHDHEGVMIKLKSSVYVSGRPRGQWFKWKREAKLVDAVLMYAQRGHGKRSSYYSDFTFGVWQGSKILPIGKAYSGFTDDELQQLDKFVRHNTIGRFGPVRELEKTLVVEVAFDSAHYSPRHKSGIALRFPRINRIRWDKPANEVQDLTSVKAELLANE